MIIRRLTNKDSPNVVSLILPIQQEEFGVNVTIDDQPDIQDIEKFYTQQEGLFLGAFLADELVGTIAYLNIGHHAAALRKMFVKIAFRGKEFKIAVQLLQALEEEAKQNGIHHIYLGTVAQMKAAHRFYEKNGFQKCSKEQLPSYFPLMEVDNVFYQKELQ
ncbi:MULTISPECIES: GNAT family N-acetyltransferase [Chitinophagaceae]